MPLPARHFYMIRHGQTEANEARIMAGSLDSPLTALGRTQAESARHIVESLAIKPKTIIHSHLSRARDTAHIINTQLSLPISEDPDFAELHAGDWEGVPYEACEALLTDWPDPPNGERFDDFITRVRRGKAAALSKEEDPVLIVAHGGVFRAFGKIYNLNMPGVENCHLHEFMPDPGNKNFPWRVFHYDLCEETRKVIRRVSDAFHGADDPADKIA